MALEVAYRFDSFGSKALKIAPFVFSRMFATSVIGLFADHILTLQRRTFDLTISTSTFIIAAAVLFGLCMFLRSLPITEVTFETYPAQAAYLKNEAYFALLAVVFLILPFHFIAAVERERGRHNVVTRLVEGNRSVHAKGTLYPRLSVRTSLLVVIAILSLVATSHLLEQLKPGHYMNMFVRLIYLRAILYFGSGIDCLVWY